MSLFTMWHISGVTRPLFVMFILNKINKILDMWADIQCIIKGDFSTVN